MVIQQRGGGGKQARRGGGGQAGVEIGLAPAGGTALPIHRVPLSCQPQCCGSWGGGGGAGSWQGQERRSLLDQH
jgi:hypothetical protein